MKWLDGQRFEQTHIFRESQEIVLFERDKNWKGAGLSVSIYCTNNKYKIFNYNFNALEKKIYDHPSTTINHR